MKLSRTVMLALTLMFVVLVGACSSGSYSPTALALENGERRVDSGEERSLPEKDCLDDLRGEKAPGCG